MIINRSGRECIAQQFAGTAAVSERQQPRARLVRHRTRKFTKAWERIKPILDRNRRKVNHQLTVWYVSTYRQEYREIGPGGNQKFA